MTPKQHLCVTTGCCNPKSIALMKNQPKNVIDYFKACDGCCTNHNLNLKRFFKICEDNPDSILTLCRKQHLKDDPELDGYSQIKSSHAEALGDPKYHYLMVDVSTSMTCLESQSVDAIQSKLFNQYEKVTDSVSTHLFYSKYTPKVSIA